MITKEQMPPLSRSSIVSLPWNLEITNLSFLNLCNMRILRLELRLDLSKNVTMWLDLRLDLTNILPQWFYLRFDMTNFLKPWLYLNFYSPLSPLTPILTHFFSHHEVEYTGCMSKVEYTECMSKVFLFHQTDLSKDKPTIRPLPQG